MKAKPDDQRPIWAAYTRWLKAENIQPGAGVRVTDAFRAGFLAGERAEKHAAEARRLHEHGNLMP